jgi:Raf kinase inhibitor-like YbhB/YbcL family protein
MRFSIFSDGSIEHIIQNERSRLRVSRLRPKGVMSIQVTSKAFESGQPIPPKYTADGENLSPALRWDGAPEGTRELALIVDDPDAPRPEPFVHWVIYKIPADAAGLPEGIPHGLKVATPAGAMQGTNSFGNIGYDGPAPPPGHGTHHYHFRLYALDQPLNLKGGLDKQALLRDMSGHILDEGELVGTYERPRRT